MKRAAMTALLLFALAHCPSGRALAQDEAAESAAEELRRKSSEAGSVDEVIEPLREFVWQYPERRQETIWLAQIWMQEGMYAEAAELLKGAIKRWPKDFQVAEMLGNSYLELGRPDDAVAAWHSILGDSESDVPRYRQVSRAEWNAGMFDRAIETLKEARRFERYYAQLTAAIVRMERTRGNDRGAFIESLSGFEMEEMPDIGRAGEALSAFRDAGGPAGLIEAVDSIAEGGGRNVSFFHTLHAALLVETGDYTAASEYLVLAGAGEVTERDLYSFVLHLFALGGYFGDPAFEDYLGRASSLFIGRYGESPRGARVLLGGAAHAAIAAGRGGPGERAAAARAVAMADSTISHRRGRGYSERARLIKAKVSLEYLHDPAAALRAVDSGEWRYAGLIREAQDIRLEAVMLSGSREEAMRRFAALEASPDSSLAVSGKYGRGMVLFYSGEFDEAAKALSEVAAEAPGSRWANDALGTAVLIRRAETGDPAVLAAFASAMRAGGSGRFEAAADSLAAAAGRYPHSPLAPEALYESALMLERAGRQGEAAGALARVADGHPLSRAAPRAVETLAAILEESDPEEASRWYAVFLDRYGEDPWVTRVRGRYMRHRKRLETGREQEVDGR